MQITTNEAYVKRRATIGLVGTIAGFVVLGLGMFISIQQTQHPEEMQTWVALVPWVTLGLGILALNVGKYYAMRYGTRPRVDRALAQALKGLDHRYHLYNFGPNLPAEHVLVTPNAVVTLETRPFIGDVIHQGERWTRPFSLFGMLQRLTDGGLGNPTAEARRNADAVRNVLRERLGDEIGKSVAVVPIIVFTNPRVKLQVTDPAVPVVLLADLRGAIRRLKESGRLAPEVQRRLTRALQWDAESDTNPASTTRSNTWQRIQK